MSWQKFSYCFKEAMQNMKRNLFTNCITICTISIALFMLSVFLLLSLNVKEILQTFGDKIHITLYLDNALTENEIQDLIKKITTFREIRDIHFVSRNDALYELKKILKNQDAILDNLTPNPLPQSFDITIKRDYQNSNSIEPMIERLKKYPGITDIEYGDIWLKKFTTVFNFLNLIGILITGMIILATVFIVSNTIKLSINSRNAEIEIMKLVGATNRFIKFPFFLEGVVQGTLGSLIAVGLLFALYRVSVNWLVSHRFLELSLISLSFFPQDLVWMIILSGSFLGALGSMASLGRFLKE
jgi:cell division transport system permease protein